MEPDEPDTRPRLLSILLAEDHPVNAKVCLAVLGRLGHAADVARDGREAVDRWAAGSYDAILMDVRMPGTDGLEAARVIRMREGDGRRTPIIALTAEDGPGLREQLEAAGIDAVLKKPLEPAELSALLAHHVTGCRKIP